MVVQVDGLWVLLLIVLWLFGGDLLHASTEGSHELQRYFMQRRLPEVVN